MQLFITRLRDHADKSIIDQYLENHSKQAYVYWTVHHCNSWRIKDQLDVTCYFISLLMCSACFGHQYILQQELATVLLNYHIGNLFSVRCVLKIWCGWVWVVSVLQAEASACNTDTTQNQPHQISNTQRTENKIPDVIIQQHSRKLLIMDILVSETCWVHKKWNKIASDINLIFYSSQ